MKKRKLIHQLYPLYLIIIILSFASVTWHASIAMKNFYLNHSKEVLQDRAFIIREDIRSFMVKGYEKGVRNVCKKIGKYVSTRTTVILPNGKVIADSHNISQVMDNHKDRPEIQEALEGRIGKSVRYSATNKQNMIYVAAPITYKNKIIGVIRTSVITNFVDEILQNIYIKLFSGGAVISILAAILSFYLSRKISLPLEKMKYSAELFANGDFSSQLPQSPILEISGLSEALKKMANQLDERIRVILTQHNEHDAVLSSMVEGVLAVNDHKLIISLNRAAADMLDIDFNDAKGKNIYKVLHNIKVKKLIEQVLNNKKVIGTSICIEQDTERILNVNGAVLRDDEEQKIGGLLVLHDITLLERLQKIRQDFVANVSHELKTPITSIKGFIETILDGVCNDVEETKRFLRIVLKQSDRLNYIVEDLLTLSRIERDSFERELSMNESFVNIPIENALELCHAQANKKNITIENTVSKTLKAKFNEQLIEQALVNLLTNAIKYSDNGKKVFIKCTNDDGELILSIEDQGYGIPKEHLPRIFERFYRIDKARSRKMGGTGLGLAIVKHIALVHKGRVEVESSYRNGSTFSIYIPQ